MKEFVISEVKAETAVLVGLITKTQDEAKTKEYLDSGDDEALRQACTEALKQLETDER